MLMDLTVYNHDHVLRSYDLNTILQLQACCAFTYITIPSIRCIRTQLKIYILTAQVAFLCHCYGQGNASVQAAIYLCQQLGPKVRQLLC